MRLANVDVLTSFSWRIREALTAAGITGDHGAEIDHIELFAPPSAKVTIAKTLSFVPARLTIAHHVAQELAPNLLALPPTANLLKAKCGAKEHYR